MCGRIRAYFRPVSSSYADTSAGIGIEQRYEIFTYDPIGHLDRLKWNNIMFEIETEPQPMFYKGYFMYYTAIIVRLY